MKLTFKIPVLLFIVWLQATPGFSATIVLKNGLKIEAEKYWNEGALLKYKKYGIIVGLPLERVERIEDSPAFNDDKMVAFGFDHWKIGARIETVMDAAESNDIPLHREGLISANRHFSTDLCRPYIQTHSKFEYRQNILGYPAAVTLTFTPESRRLALIAIRFSNDPNHPGRNPDDEIIEMIRKKYGEPRTQNAPLPSKDVLNWTIQGGNNIHFVRSSSSVLLTYENNLWSDRLEKERQHQIDLKRGDDFKKDAEKF